MLFEVIYAFLFFSMIRNTEEWTGTGFGFGIIKYCFLAPHQGVWFINYLTWYSGRYTILLTQLQTVCLSIEYAAQFLFDKYTVKDQEPSPEIIQKQVRGILKT